MNDFDNRYTLLITGALGQVGKRCVGLLLQRGCRVVALDIKNAANLKSARQLGRRAGTPDGNASMLHITFTDLTEREAVFRACAQHQPGAIIHLAAVVSPVCYAIPESARRVNVEGTRHLLEAANSLETAPLFIFASSSAVYGSRNPYTRDIINANTPVRPVECYGIDKIDGEKLVGESPLPYAILRLAGILSPDGIGNLSAEYSALVRATPGDNRVHGIDARDVALAFANASQLPEEHQNRLFMIAGDDSYRKTQREIEDDVVQAPGIGRLGEGASLPGDPGDALGWSFTDWMDVGDSQSILQFQRHRFDETLEWIKSSLNPILRVAIKLASPLIRAGMLSSIHRQRKRGRRGDYAAPWQLIGQLYGDQVLSSDLRRLTAKAKGMN